MPTVYTKKLMKSGRTTRSSVQRVVRSLAWLFVWLTRIMVGNIILATVAVFIYVMWYDWPKPFYGLIAAAAMIGLIAGTIFLYEWCKEKIDY